MTKDFMLIAVNKRKNEAITVQKILTEWGCYIKTRLGLHEDTLDNCSEIGTIILEIVGDKEKHAELKRKLNLLAGVSADIVNLEVKE